MADLSSKAIHNIVVLVLAVIAAVGIGLAVGSTYHSFILGLGWTLISFVLCFILFHTFLEKQRCP